MAWKVNRLCVSLILGMGLALSLLVVFDTFVAGRSEASILDTGEWEVHITPTVAVTAASYSQDRVGRAADMVPQGQVQSLANPIPQNAIGIDGERERWGLDKTYLPPDPIGDNGGPGKIDWITVTMAHDCDELYVRYQLDDGPSIALEGGRYDLFVDVDRNRDTGYRGEGKWLAVGADALVQGTTVFSFTGTTQEDWSWKQINGYPVNDIPGPSTKRDIEFKVQIADLDRSGGGLYGFDWVLWADHTWGADPIDIRDSDIYPDGGAGGATGDFYTYVFERPVPFANPERGFVRQTNTHDPYRDLSLAAYRPLVTEPGTSTLKCYREWDGVTLLHRNFWLGEYVTSTISQEYLEKMQADFDTVRDAGLKAVIRFAYTPAYTDPITCAGESDRYDASKEWIITHTKQLSDVLHSNSDVIAAAQAGFVGSWGEWWGSCHFQCDSEEGNCGPVLRAALGMLPEERMVQIRTPRYKQYIFDRTTPITRAEAHNGSYIARTGHHNDCFLCSPTDGGTYVYTPTEYPYLEEETKWVVMGGETGDYHQIAGTDPERLKCPTALQELAMFHWSFVSYDWYTGTLEIWREGGCLDEIERRLGYRFELVRSDFPRRAMVGGVLSFSLEIDNVGFAAPYNPRDVELILRHSTGVTVPLKLSTDPRFGLPGRPHVIRQQVQLPAEMPLGSYDLLLYLPDPESRLRSRPEYAIRLANRGAWEADTGYNKLNKKIMVVDLVYLPIVLGDTAR